MKSLAAGATVIVVAAGCSTSTGSAGAGSSDAPAATLAPTPSLSPTAAPTSTASPDSTAAAGSCPRPVPSQVTDVEIGERRVVATARLTSVDGRLTVGDRVTTTVRRPVLAGPDGTTMSVGELVRQSANLLSATRSVRLALEAPAAPDVGLSASQPPYDRDGRYVAYTTIRRLSAELVMTCGERRQTWRLTGDADAALGQVSCSGSSSEASRPAGTAAAEVYRDRC